MSLYTWPILQIALLVALFVDAEVKWRWWVVLMPTFAMIAVIGAVWGLLTFDTSLTSEVAPFAMLAFAALADFVIAVFHVTYGVGAMIWRILKRRPHA